MIYFYPSYRGKGTAPYFLKVVEEKLYWGEVKKENKGTLNGREVNLVSWNELPEYKP